MGVAQRSCLGFRYILEGMPESVADTWRPTRVFDMHVVNPMALCAFILSLKEKKCAKVEKRHVCKRHMETYIMRYLITELDRVVL